MKNINFTLGRVFLVLSLALFSSSTFADWTDDRDNVIDTINEVRNSVVDTLSEMNTSRGTIRRPHIQNMIADAKAVLSDNISRPEEIDSFINNGGCTEFKNDFARLSTGIFRASNSLANFHGLPVQFSIQDPGLADLVSGLPCPLLLPVDKVARKLPIFDDDFINQLNEIEFHLDIVKDIVYPNQLAQTSFSADTSESDHIELSFVCASIKELDTEVFVAQSVLLGTGVFTLGIGKIGQAAGKTIIAGPTQIEGGAMGFAGVHIKNNNWAAVGKILSGLGHGLIQVSGTVSRARGQCKLRNEHIALQADHAALSEDHAALSGDHAQLLADHTTLLANSQSLQDGQKEILRLMLTPQGRRSSDFCHEDDCEPQDLPKK